MLNNDWVQMFLSGGPVMFVLLGISILTLGIILAKTHQFARSDLGRTEVIDKALAALAEGKLSQVDILLAKSRHPVARVMERAVEVSGQPLSEEDRESATERAGMAEIHALESRLRGLDLIATIAPLLGLLGTVLGMIQAFAQVERLGSTVEPSVLAGGIWQALLTTAYGLILAIPALSASHLFQNKVEHVRELMGNAASETLSAATRIRTMERVS